MQLDGFSFAKEPRLAAALDYMAKHLDEDLHIDCVAEQAGISPRTLNRLLHEEHISFSAYLNYQRITHAVEQMADGKRTIAEIAYMTASFVYKSTADYGVRATRLRRNGNAIVA